MYHVHFRTLERTVFSLRGDGYPSPGLEEAANL